MDWMNWVMEGNKDGVPSKHDIGTGFPEHQAGLEPGLGSSGSTVAENRDYPPSCEQPSIPGIETFPAGFSVQEALTVVSSYTGPIPASQVAEYDQIVPGCAEKIINAQLIEPSQRLNKLTDAQIDQAKSGQSWAAFFMFIAIVAAIVFFAFGNNVAGGLLLGLPVMQAITSFIGDLISKDKRDKSE